jgi:5-hydroxyisourate hydrolase-like protein (transthyretin family)
MRTSILAALVLIVSIGIAVSWSQTVTANQRKSILNTYGEKNDLVMLASAEQQANVTAHIGDVVLSGNDVMVVKDVQLDLNGSLLMSVNSTLILDNGILYPAFEKGQHSFILHDNARIIMRRGSKIVSGIFDFTIHDNALVNMSDSDLEKSITIDLPHATLHAVNSQIRAAEVYGTSRLQIVNSTAGQLLCHGDAHVVDSHIQSLVVAQNAYPIYVDLVNTTYDQLDTTNLGKGIVHVNWYLMISVESQGTPLQGVNVQVYYVANDSLAAQQTTPSDGRVQFELPEWEITEAGSRYLGDYTVKTSYGAAQAEANVTLTASKDMTVELPKETEPFPTALVIAAIIIAAGAVAITLGTIVHRRKKRAIKHSA